MESYSVEHLKNECRNLRCQEQEKYSDTFQALEECKTSGEQGDVWSDNSDGKTVGTKTSFMSFNLTLCSE